MAASKPKVVHREPDQMSIRDVLTIIFKHKTFIAVFAVSVVTLVVSTVLLLPRKYEVEATLLVNRTRAEVAMAPTDSPQLIVSGSEQDLNAEIEVLTSRNLIEEVAEIVGPLEPELRRKSGLDALLNTAWSYFEKVPGSSLNKLVVEFQRDIRITAIARSNAIRILYVTEDPEWATEVVSTLIEIYLERRTEASQSSQAVSFFEEQMNDAERRLVELENKIEDLAARSSITMMKGPQGTDSLAAQKALAMEGLAQLESELATAEVALQDQQQQAVVLRARLAQEPERMATASRNNITAASEEIEVALAELKLRRDELLQDFRPDSRYVRDIETQIALAEERLEQANAAAEGVNRTEANPFYVQLRGDLLRVEAQLEGTSARVNYLRDQVRATRNQLKNLNENAFELDTLRRSATSAENDFLLYRKKYEEARISSAMDQEKIINVTVAQPAMIPLRPLRRGLLKKTLLALFVGVFGGVGIAYALEQFFNRSFTTGDDIERRLGIPHLASIPDSSRMI